jgi:hypothetical protein
MVFFTEKPKRVLAACCKVEVIYGALGLPLSVYLHATQLYIQHLSKHLIVHLFQLYS